MALLDSRFSAVQRLTFTSGSGLRDTHLPLLARLPALQHLSLSKCATVRGMGLEAITGLCSLSLHGCAAMSDQSLHHLAVMTRLTKLSMVRQQLTGAGLAHLSALTALNTLEIRECAGLTNAGMQRLSGLAALRELKLNSSTFLQPPLDLLALQSMTALQRLGLQSIPLRPPPDAPLRLPALQALNVAWARASDNAGDSCIIGMFAAEDNDAQPVGMLRELRISCDEVFNHGFRALRYANVLSLVKLQLWGSGKEDFMDVFVEDLTRHLATFPALEEVALDYCMSMKDDHVALFSRLHRLRRLILSRCHWQLVTRDVVHRFVPLPVTISFTDDAPAW